MVSDNRVDIKIFTSDIKDADVVKIIVIGSFILLSILITIFVFSKHSGDINDSFLFLFPQLYYIPIILLSIWYPKRSIQATILLISGFLAIISYYYFKGIQIDPFVAGLNVAIYLWVVIATTQLAHSSGLINLKYLNFFRNANTGLLIINKKDKKILEINQKIIDTFGYEKNEIVGKTTDEIKNLLFKDKTNFLDDFEVSKDIYDSKTRLIKKSGDIITVLISCRNNIKDATIECTIVDITEQENENINAKEENRKLIDYISSSPDLMFVLDEKGSILKFQFMNNNVEKAEYQDFLGKSLSEIMEKPGESDYKLFIKEVIEKGRTLPFNAEIRLKNNIRDFFVILAPYNDSNGRTNSVIGNLHEKNKHTKEFTADLINEFETKRWNNFVNTAAHELRTPLQPILGYLHLLLDEPEQSGFDEESTKILQKCLISVERECSVVEKMLETGLMNSYPVKILLSDFSLHNIINDVLSIGGYSKSAKVLNNISQDTIIRADFDRMYQVFEGIISNAVKYNTEPRIIEILYDEDEINQYVIFKDNGKGIPKCSLENIFEPFYITNSEELSREYGRIGLGLSIARRYVRVHGGDIHVKSEEGKGSTFSVILPKYID